MDLKDLLHHLFLCIRDTIYLDNLYDITTDGLVKGEELYLYIYSENRNEPIIDYFGKNINYKNNEYNIFYVEQNIDDSEDNQNILIINNYNEKNSIIGNVLFCEDDTDVNIFYQGSSEEERPVYYSEGSSKYMKFKLSLDNADNKLRFKSNKPFVFSHSFYDYNDYSKDREDPYKNDNNDNERQILYDQNIIKVVDKDKEKHIINIIFSTNYINSSTRYIIIIAPRDSEYNKINFNNPCYIAQLLKNKPDNIIIEAIYDVGEKYSISAEIDISKIVNDNNEEYIVNIISQELRYEKMTKFYEAYQFNHPSKEEEKPVKRRRKARTNKN